MLRYLYAAVGVVLVLGVYAYITRDSRSDEQKINAAIESVVAGANARNLSQCMAYVSSDFKTGSDINRDRLRLLVAQAFRSEAVYHVQAVVKSLEITGDSAEAEVLAIVTGWDLGNANYQRSVQVKFARERSRRLLVIPEDQWRITYVDSLVVEQEDMFF